MTPVKEKSLKRIKAHGIKNINVKNVHLLKKTDLLLFLSCAALIHTLIFDILFTMGKFS